MSIPGKKLTADVLDIIAILTHDIAQEIRGCHHHHRAKIGFVTLNFGRRRHRMASTQNALPGQSGIATANELDQNNNPVTIQNPDGLTWTSSDPALSVVATGDGTPTAKVTVSTTAQPGSYSISFTDPGAPGIPITAGTVVVGSQSVAASGSVDLGPFS